MRLQPSSSAWSAIWALILVGSLFTSAGCAHTTPLRRHEFTRLCMGVQARIVLYASDERAATTAAAAAFDDIARLDACMSDYRLDSELMRLCAASDNTPVAVSEDLFTILGTAQALAEQSRGAFDVTIGPLSRLWRSSRRIQRFPSPDELAAARARTGWRNIVLDSAGGTVALARSDMQLDLGAIAKGYAAQCAVETLRSRGVPRCLVALSGDIVLGDAPPAADGWSIAIDHGPDAPPHRPLVLSNIAVSTSGPTQQFVEIGGRRYSHIIDPRTGLGLTRAVHATVIARRGELSDALATTLCIVGPEHARELLAHYPGCAALLDTESSGGVERLVIDPDARWLAPRR